MSEKILIVDDDANLLRLIGQVLQRAGYQPIAATNGASALQKIRGEQPDLVILDVMLPGMSGIELCKQLRENEETAALPIIMLSALGQVDNTIEGLEAGADEYLSKPINPKELVARVRALLQRTARLRRAQSQDGAGGKVWGFIGAKGGVGTTTVVLNVAIALAQRDESVIAVELRPHFGSFTAHLGHTPEETLRDLLGLDVGRINGRMLKMHLTQDPIGMQVLYGPNDFDAEEQITAEQSAAIVDGLASLADYVLLDLPSSPASSTEAALRLCESIYLMVTPEPASVSAAKGMLELLKQWGIGRGVVEIVVVNQAPLAVAVKINEIGEELNSDIIAIIPPVADACVASQQRGRPLSVIQPQNPAVARFVELAERLRLRA